MRLTDIYAQADKAQADAQRQCPDMLCRAGCDLCCREHGSPITYAVEWEPIRALLEADPALYASVYAAWKELKQRWRERLHDPGVPTLQAALFDTPCPFLAQGCCQIYALRPLTCRAFGNTALSGAGAEGIYTCNLEKARWETWLPLHGQPALVSREGLFTQLETLNGAPPLSLLAFLDRYFRHASPTA